MTSGQTSQTEQVNQCKIMIQAFLEHINESQNISTSTGPVDKFRSKLFNWEDYIVGIYLSTVCILAVALNTMVIYTCIKHWNSLVMSDYYILNLACSDVILPLSGFPLAISSSFGHRWIHGDQGCTAYGLMGFFFGLVSITTLTTMAVTRYVNICHPHIDITNGRLTRSFILFSYLYALVWSLIPLSGWGSYTVEAYGTSCTLQWDENRSFITLMSVFCIITPSFIMTGAYGLILIKCRRSNRNLTNWNRQNKISRKETYLIKITFAMCWGFLVAWMPYAVVSMWTAYGDITVLDIRFTLVAVLLAKSSTVVNPILYFMLSKKFRPLLNETINLDALRCYLNPRMNRPKSESSNRTINGILRNSDGGPSNSESSGNGIIRLHPDIVESANEVFL